jgi:hypothetical protein
LPDSLSRKTVKRMIMGLPHFWSSWDAGTRISLCQESKRVI